MLKIEQTKLTSNALINKLLLSNASITETLSALHDENLKHAVTKEDIHYVIYDILNLSSQFHTLDIIAKIQLIGLDEMIDRFEHEEYSGIKIALASRGHYLDKFTYDKHPQVRVHVAEHKHNLDILINDRDSRVRKSASIALNELRQHSSKEEVTQHN
jgi:hypothetical protein